MSSKTSSYKMRVAMGKKPWAFALSFISFFFALPVYCALSLQEYIHWASAADPKVGGAIYVAKRLSQWFSVDNIPVTCVMVIGSLLMALSFFAYLNNKKQIDFYHSLPVKRGKLFLINSGAGLGSLWLAYLINLGLAIGVVYAMGMGSLLSWTALLTGAATHLLFSFTLFFTAAVACGLTGVTVISALLTIFLLGAAPSFTAMLRGLLESFYPSYYGALYPWEAWVTWGSPFTRYIAAVTRYQPMDTLAFALVAGAGLLLAVLAWLLHRARPSEGAGHAMAYPKASPWIKYPVALWVAAGLALLFHEIGDNSLSSPSYAWLIFGILMGAVLTCQIGEIIFHADFRAFKKNLGGLAIFVALLLAVVFVNMQDVTGFNSYLPRAVDIAQINIRLPGVNSYVYDVYPVNAYERTQQKQLQPDAISQLEQGPIVDQAGIEAALSIVSKLMEESKLHTQTSSYSSLLGILQPADDSVMDTVADTPTAEDQRNKTDCYVVYTLTDGSRVARQYQTAPVKLKDISQELDAIYGNPMFQKAQYSLFSYPAANIRLETPTSFTDYGRYNKYSYQNNPYLTLQGEKLQQLLADYQRELTGLNPAYLRQNAPIGTLSFRVYQQDPGQQTVKDINTAVALHFCYPLFADFTDTLADLEQLGFDKMGLQDTPEVISKITVSTYETKNGEGTDVTYHTSEEIAQILAQSIPCDASYYNSFMDVNYNRYITITYLDNQRYSGGRYYLLP